MKIDEVKVVKLLLVALLLLSFHDFIFDQDITPFSKKNELSTQNTTQGLSSLSIEHNLCHINFILETHDLVQSNLFSSSSIEFRSLFQNELHLNTIFIPPKIIS